MTTTYNPLFFHLMEDDTDELSTIFDFSFVYNFYMDIKIMIIIKIIRIF